MSSQLMVLKASGALEPFSEKKLRDSIGRAKIPKDLENDLVLHIKGSLYHKIPTSEIYRQIEEFLAASHLPHTKGIYGLKKGLMLLGPGGFPFEKYIAAVLAEHGFITQTNLILHGRCVEHEIDIFAEKNAKKYMLECKFHNRPGARSDIKVALYTHARFEDLQLTSVAGVPSFDQAWIVTNTKTTTEAIKYADCVGMKIIGWNYPEKENLQNLIEPKGLHPVTCLSSLSSQQQHLVLNYGIVLCRDLKADKAGVMGKIGLTAEQKQAVKAEVEAICSHHGSWEE